MRCLKGGSRLHGAIAGDAATAVEASAAHGCVQGLFESIHARGKSGQRRSTPAMAWGWSRWSARGGLRSVRRSFAGAESPAPRARPLLPCASHAPRPTGAASLHTPGKPASKERSPVQPVRGDLSEAVRSFLTYRRSMPTPADSARLEQERREVPSAKAFRPSRPVWQRPISSTHRSGLSSRTASYLMTDCSKQRLGLDCGRKLGPERAWRSRQRPFTDFRVRRVLLKIG